MALTDKLTNIANAIRAKTETTEPMTLDEMPTKIANIETKSEPNLQDKIIEITENGITTITADEGYDGLNNVSVTTNVAGESIYNTSIEKTLIDGIYDNSTSTYMSSINKIIKEINEDIVLEGPTSNANFAGCTNLEKIKLVDFKNVTLGANRTFLNCSSLKNPLQIINTDNVGNFQRFFEGCTSITKVPNFSTASSGEYMYMCKDCTNLVHVPLINGTKLKSYGDGSNGVKHMFLNCPNLSDESLNNILKMCSEATNITKNKTLAYVGLTSEQATKCTTLSNYSIFITAGWTTGY